MRYAGFGAQGGSAEAGYGAAEAGFDQAGYAGYGQPSGSYKRANPYQQVSCPSALSFFKGSRHSLPGTTGYYIKKESVLHQINIILAIASSSQCQDFLRGFKADTTLGWE